MLSTDQAQFSLTDPNIGRLLANRYQLQELIGTGSMGQVYLANDVLLGGVPVAVKFLALSIQNQKIRVQERFEREAKTCALLGQKSIHIVRVMDYGVDEFGTPFYVMEYLQGESLGHIIRLEHITLARFLGLVRQISLGLQCAHQGIQVDGEICPIIHRDIKPSNIAVVQDSSLGELVKILDFGIAKLLQPDSDQTSYYLGTLAYSSPEQMEGNELDNRSDIYSLGVMMFEMLTGKIPLQADTNCFGGWYKAHRFQPPLSFATVAPRLQIPQAVENLVMSCLAKEPSDRPQSISEILNTLVSIQSVSEVNDNQVLPLKSQSIQSPQQADGVEQIPSWPKNKPIADIVFPNPLCTNGEVMAALWVMLPQQEIQKRLQSTRYNQFLFIKSPHPMVLWISVLHSREHGPKWLPCYLDMKTLPGQEIVRVLEEKGCYQLLLFAREAPKHVCTCLPLTIAPTQRQRLQEWATTSQTLVSPVEPQVSKSLLKKEFEKIKPQILMKLEAIHQDFLPKALD